jgi:glucosamine--fructose-6-phosphate aminotransferase (isomerizing)
LGSIGLRNWNGNGTDKQAYLGDLDSYYFLRQARNIIEKGTPCIAIVANDDEKSATLSSATELKSRGGFIIGIAPENNAVFDCWISVPDLGNASPIASVIPAQLLAYYLAVGLGHDPDKPRNLAKSVTVK